MGFGMGLGAFTDGMARGLQLRGDIEDRKTAADDRERRRTIEDETMAWEREDRAYAVRQRSEAEGDKNAIRDITAGARDEFDRGVEAGEYDPKEFDEFWDSFAMPRLTTELLEQGKFAEADALESWSESKAARKGGRKFAEAMFKANTGDMDGALEAAFDAAKTKGYIDSDFAFKGKEEIVDAAGNILGYQLTMVDDEGNEHVQDVAIDDVPKFISTIVNPEAAWTSQQAAAAKASERQAKITDELVVHEGKAAIDDRDNDAEQRAAAIKTVRERNDAAVTMGGGTPFDQLAADQQEKLIADELALQRGSAQPAVPTPNVIVDQNTGVAVGGMAPTSGPAMGLGSVPASPPVASTGQPQVDAALPLPTEQQMIQNAAEALVKGENPQNVARMLQQTGIDPAKWPQGLVPQ